jgi:DNA-binding FrmR family transcriptional regulator
MEYTNSDELLKALRRIEGQARGVHRMIEDGQPCDRVVRQVSAIRGAVDRLNHRLVAGNLLACLEDANLEPQIRGRLDRGLQALVEIRS